MSEDIKNMSDAEKIAYLESKGYRENDVLDYGILDVIKSIKDDNTKLGAMQKYYSGTEKFTYATETDFQERLRRGASLSEKIDIVLTLDSDDIKLRFYDDLPSNDRYNRARILASLKDDTIKLEMLGREGVFTGDQRAIIVAGLNDDAKKLEFLTDLKGSYNKAKVIASLKDNEKKAEMLETIDPMYRQEIIDSMQEDKQMTFAGNEPIVEPIQTEQASEAIPFEINNEQDQIVVYDSVENSVKPAAEYQQPAVQVETTEPIMDFSGMTNEQLIALQAAVSREIATRFVAQQQQTVDVQVTTK